MVTDLTRISSSVDDEQHTNRKPAKQISNSFFIIERMVIIMQFPQFSLLPFMGPVCGISSGLDKDT